MIRNYYHGNREIVHVDSGSSEDVIRKVLLLWCSVPRVERAPCCLDTTFADQIPHSCALNHADALGIRHEVEITTKDFGALDLCEHVKDARRLQKTFFAV